MDRNSGGKTDGERYLLIPADDGVEVNGVSVSIPNEEHS